MLLGKVLVVGVCYDCGNSVEVYRLLKVVLLPSDPMLHGEDLLVRGSGVVHDVWFEELRLVDADVVQCVVFRDPSHFFSVDDKRESASLPAVSAGFEVCRNRCNHTNEFVDWPVIGRSCNSWEGGRVEAGFDHCADGGGARFRHGEHVVGLRHAL